MRAAVVVRATTLAIIAAACGSPPAAPSVPLTPQPAVYTTTGRIVGTVTGEPVPGAMVTIGSHTLVTDASGEFTLTDVAAVNDVVVAGGGLITRTGRLLLSTRQVTIDVIQDRTPFDLAYFRQIGRNAFETDGALEPLRPLSQAPKIQIQTVDTRGDTVPADLVEMAETAIRESAPQWSGGRLPITTITRGPESREGTTGWVTVVWAADDDPYTCGRATLGTSTGWIRLHHKKDSCRCGGRPVAPKTVRHELGHVYGFWHSSGHGEVMSKSRTYGDCDYLPSEREQAHAKYLYARQAGNLDPDTEPLDRLFSLRPVIVIND